MKDHIIICGLINAICQNKNVSSTVPETLKFSLLLKKWISDILGVNILDIKLDCSRYLRENDDIELVIKCTFAGLGLCL